MITRVFAWGKEQKLVPGTAKVARRYAFWALLRGARYEMLCRESFRANRPLFKETNTQPVILSPAFGSEGPRYYPQVVSGANPGQSQIRGFFAPSSGLRITGVSLGSVERAIYAAHRFEPKPINPVILSEAKDLALSINELRGTMFTLGRMITFTRRRERTAHRRTKAQGEILRFSQDDRIATFFRKR
jgi:hypothetical protein